MSKRAALGGSFFIIKITLAFSMEIENMPDFVAGLSIYLANVIAFL